MFYLFQLWFTTGLIQLDLVQSSYALLYMVIMKEELEKICVAMWHFNTFLNLDERIRAPIRISEVQPNRECVMQRRLSDVKHTGRLYTWTNR